MQDPSTLSVSIIIPDNPSHSQPSSPPIQNIQTSRTIQNALSNRTHSNQNNQQPSRSRQISNSPHNLSIQNLSHNLSIQNPSHNLSISNSSQKTKNISNLSRSKVIPNISQLNNDSVSQNKFSQQPFQTMNDFDLGTQNTINAFGNGLSHHLTSLRRTNLISILSSTKSQTRTQRQNKLIMQILKHQPFFSIISANYKLLYEISSKLEYKSFQQSQHVYKINEITESYFILIRGGVQLSIPERMITTQTVMQSENEKILRQIQKRNQLKQNKNKKSAKSRPKTHNRSKSKTDNHVHKNSNNQESNNKAQQVNQNGDKSQKVDLVPKIQQNTPLKTLNQDSSPVKCPQKQQMTQKQKKSHTQTKSVKRPSVNQKSQLGQSVKKTRQLSLSKKSSTKGDQTLWSPTQFNLDDRSDILSEKQSQDMQIHEQPIVNNQKQGTQLEYIDKIVKVVEEGQCFGQITFGEISRRATNAIAKYDSHLIVIKKQHYDLISKASISSQMKVRYDFLINLQLFKKVYRYSIETFLYYMTEVPCQYKSTLYHEGDQIKYVYLVKHGQFNLSKTIIGNLNRKTHPSTKTIPQENADIIALRRQQSKWRQGVFKKIYSGQILGDCQAFLKKTHYNETCTCTSQSGSLYRIDKNVFIEKILSSQNQVVAIKKYLNAKFKTKFRYLDNYLEKQFNNEVIARILPASKSCDRNIRKRRSDARSQTTLGHMQLINQGDDPSLKNEFFDEFNRTFRPSATKKRIFATCAINLKKPDYLEEDNPTKIMRCKTAMHRSISLNVKTEPVKQAISKSMMVNKSEIPSCIKDIVAVVNCKQQYFMNRNKNKSGQKKISFQFEKHKLPIFIAQKFKHLVNRLQMKKK